MLIYRLCVLLKHIVTALNFPKDMLDFAKVLLKFQLHLVGLYEDYYATAYRKGLLFECPLD